MAKISCGARGVAASTTEAGPPDRMIAFGAISRMRSNGTEKGWISQ